MADNTKKSKKTTQETVENEQKKSMLNCSNIEFVKYANMYKNDIEAFMNATKIDEIKRGGQQLTGKETDEEKQAIIKKNTREKWDKIFNACFVENAELTMDIISKMYFISVEELEKMSPFEIQNALILILADRRLNDFFTVLRLWGLLDTES